LEITDGTWVQARVLAKRNRHRGALGRRRQSRAGGMGPQGNPHFGTKLRPRRRLVSAEAGTPLSRTAAITSRPRKSRWTNSLWLLAASNCKGRPAVSSLARPATSSRHLPQWSTRTFDSITPAAEMSQCRTKGMRSGQIPRQLTISIRIQSVCSARATAVVADCRYSRNRLTAGKSMVSHVMSEGRLFGLTVSDWSVLLGSFMLCGLLTLLF
jgi:hypothetical protein